MQIRTKPPEALPYASGLSSKCFYFFIWTYSNAVKQQFQVVFLFCYGTITPYVFACPVQDHRPVTVSFLHFIILILNLKKRFLKLKL